jgi:hypothetical protein
LCEERRGTPEAILFRLGKGELNMSPITSKPCQMLVLACSIFLLPWQQVLAAGPQHPLGDASPSVATGAVRDAALQPGGVLHGQVVDAQGKAVAHAVVRLVRAGVENAPVAVSETNAQGQFEFARLSGGVYRLETAAGGAMYRLWTPDTAPPSATRAALLVQGDSTVRGNLGGLHWLEWTLIGIGVAAAIAIPLALADDDDAS